MNIFYLDRDPILAAQAQCDAHVVKMILEGAQMLCAAAHSRLSERGEDTAIVPYKPTHKHHPCTVWTGEDGSHAEWLTDHTRALGEEFTYRYGGVHASIRAVDAVWPILLDVLPFGRWREPPLAMPDHYKQPDHVLAYRAFYRAKRDAGMKWRYTRRAPPAWLEVRHRERELA